MNKHVRFGISIAILAWGTSTCAAQRAELQDEDANRILPPSTTSSGDKFQPAAPFFPGPSRVQPQSAESLPTAPSPLDVTTPTPLAAKTSIVIRYVINKPVTETFRTPDGKTHQVTKYIMETREQSIEFDADLESLELPPEGKRAAVLAVTAARHQGLLEKLKAAKTPEEKEAASLALEENYTEHYAIETWWRQQKLADLETRLQELRAQVTQREESEEKYVEAAMTIAELWASGIGITPPTPSRLPAGSPAVVLPPAQSPQTYYTPSRGPHTFYTPSRGPNTVYFPSNRPPTVNSPTSGPQTDQVRPGYRPAVEPDNRAPGSPEPAPAANLPPAASTFDDAPTHFEKPKGPA